MIGATWALWLLAAPAPASAQDAPASSEEAPERVILVVEECASTEIPPRALADALQTELRGDGVGSVVLVPDGELAPEASGLAVLRVTAMPCEPGAMSFLVGIDDRLTRKRVEQMIDVGDAVASARLRALALAIAELLRASWTELVLVEESPPHVPVAIYEGILRRVVGVRDGLGLDAPGDPRRPPPAPPEPPPVRSARAALAAALVVRSFPSGSIAPFGGRLSLDLVPLRELTLRIDAEAVAGQAFDPLGTIELGAATIGLAPLLAIGLGEHALLWIGPRVVGGIAWARGIPGGPGVVGSSGVGPVLSIGGVIELDLVLADPISLRFGIGGDGIAIGHLAQVSGLAAAGITGGSIGAWAGMAVSL